MFKSTACEIRGAASYLNVSKNSIEASHWINFPWATQRLRFGVPVAAVSVQIFLIAPRALATNTPNRTSSRFHSHRLLKPVSSRRAGKSRF